MLLWFGFAFRPLVVKHLCKRKSQICFGFFFSPRTYSINKDNYFPFHRYAAFPEERNSNSISGAKKEDVWFSTPQIDCNFS